jgi:D-alanyl-D-alanine carboxypeptidase
LAFTLTFFALLGLFAPRADARPERHAAMILDANTGAILHNEDGDAIRHPASLTKMMTLYLTFETLQSGRLKMSDMVTISEAAAGVAPSKLDLDPGEQISVADAIKALITKSANDVAVAIAEKIGGTEANFVRLMNARARDLGMTKTHFENPNGLPNDAHVSTARDMITLALHLQDDYPTYYPLFATRTFSYRGKTYRNHNTMLNTFAGIDGIKTGYTRASGFNIVTSLRRGGQHLVGAVFGGASAASRNSEMRVLLTRALNRASTKKTRKPQPLLLAKLNAPPKPANRPASKRPAKADVAEAAAPAPRPFAPAKAQTAAVATATASAARPRPAAESAQVAAADPPVTIFKVRHVPILAKDAAARPSPDETTDMEDPESPSSGASSSDAANPNAAGQTEPARVAATEGASASGFAGKLSHSFAQSRAQAADEPTPTLVSNNVRRPTPLDDKIAMLGAADTIPAPAAAPAQPPAPALSAAASAAVARPEASTPQRGLPPSTLGAQARALYGAKSEPRPAAAPRPATTTAGHYQVQIGAFASVTEAQHALSTVQGRVGALLAGIAPVTQPTMKDGRRIFRARFAGFNADRATSTCTELRRQAVDCFVMAGD